MSKANILVISKKESPMGNVCLFLVRKMECEDKGRNLSKLMEVDVTEQTLGHYFCFVSFSHKYSLYPCQEITVPIGIACRVRIFQLMRTTHR